MATNPVILWVRSDMRMGDNRALGLAAAQGPLVVVAIEDDAEGATGALRQWRRLNRAALAKAYHAHKVPFLSLRGDSAAVLVQLARVCGARAVFGSCCYDPASRAIEMSAQKALTRAGVDLTLVPGAYVMEPGSVRSQSGAPYQVFTPFYRAAMAQAAGVDSLSPPAPSVRGLRGCPAFDLGGMAQVALDAPMPRWMMPIAALWPAGEAAAMQRLDDFISESMAAYEQGRDRPGIDGTSRLSPYLAVGAITPAQVAHRIRSHLAGHGMAISGANAFWREIIWRDFSAHMLFHNPSMRDQPFQAKFAAFPWVRDDAAWDAMRRGQTGFPIIDAGMRQLWQTGWMHNRVRMIVGSFLVKDLRLNWLWGQGWFEDTLIDADPASNTGNWQWVAGCGVDAAPYFRVFNPTLQSRRFDPMGAYIRRYVPEIASLPDGLIHEPARARPVDLADAGVVLGRHYPLPLCDHGRARLAALAAFRSLPARPAEG